MRPRCFITPDHYVFRMLYSQGVPLEDLGIPRRDGGAGRERSRARSGAPSPRTITLFRGTPTRIWLDHAFATVFGIDERLTPESADRVFDRINDCLAQPAFRPRALFERFNIEVLATTESPLDPLAHHAKIRASRLEGPRRSPRTGPIRSSIRSSTAFATTSRSSARSRGENTATWRGYLAAHRKRRAFFKTMGATSTDHGHPDGARPAISPKRECQRLLDRALVGHRDRRTRPSSSAARC